MLLSRSGGFRRLTAALSGAFLLQLALLGWGAPCPMAHGAEHATHAAMAMPADHATPVEHHAPAPVGCQVTGDDGCGVPAAPGQCAAMATCAATAAPVAATLAQLAPARIAAELPEPASIHSGFAPAPELPPPRA